MACMKDRLKQVRGDLRKTQKEMAIVVGCHERAWQKYEKGDNSPGSEILEALAKLGYNTNWILTGVGQMYVDTHQQVEGFASDDGIVSYKAGNALEALQIKPVMDAVMEVMTSDHSGVKLALTQNALIFQEMVRNANKLSKLEDRIEKIERQRSPREDDFKTQETKRAGEHPEKKHHASGN